MKKARVKSSSSLIKHRGDKLARLNHAKMSRLEDLITEMELANAWVRKPIAVTASGKINHASKSVYDIIAFCAWRSNRRVCDEPIEVIAILSNTSVRQTWRCVNELVKANIISREGHTNGRYANVFRVVGIEKLPNADGSTKPKCDRCNVYRKTNDAGICGKCRKDDVAEREVAEQLALGFTTQTVIWANMKAHGSKCGAKEIERALLKLTIPVESIKPVSKESASKAVESVA